MSAETKQKVDILIHAKWIIPVVPKNLELEDHSIAILGRKILDICPTEEAKVRFHSDETVDLGHHIIFPGLINAHGHAPMTLFRGVADDIPLKQWLEEKIWPLEGKFVDAKFARQGAELAIAEMIRSGTSCFADMYFFPDEVAKAALEAKIRVQLASPVLDFPTIWAQDADEYIAKATQLHDDYRNNELISTAFGPHAPYTVSDQPLQKLYTLAEELDLPIHMNVHETLQEVSDAVSTDGRRPLQRLAELGLISPRLICVHATELLEEEMKLLADNGAHVIHCPESNLKLASGFCEVGKLASHGVNIGLGTDGCASNNDLDMISEMRSAALLAKAVAKDASAVPAAQALEMATINNARALGLDNEIGSLERGKQADIAAIDIEAINNMPLYNPTSQLIYSSQSSQVSHLWCAGQSLLEHGELKTIDTVLLRSKIQTWQKKIGNS